MPTAYPRNPHDQSDAALLARQLAVMDHAVQLQSRRRSRLHIRGWESPLFTQIGFERMMEAHAAGRDVIIEVDGGVIFRLPA